MTNKTHLKHLKFCLLIAVRNLKFFHTYIRTKVTKTKSKVFKTHKSWHTHNKCSCTKTHAYRLVWTILTNHNSQQDNINKQHFSVMILIWPPCRKHKYIRVFTLTFHSQCAKKNRKSKNTHIHTHFMYLNVGCNYNSVIAVTTACGNTLARIVTSQTALNCVDKNYNNNNNKRINMPSLSS